MQISQTLHSIIAGVLQGATELLPVSSSGHLLLLSQLMQKESEILEIAILHLGTLASIFIVFRKDLKLYFDKNFLLKVLISSVPAGIMGFLIEEILEFNLSSPYLIIFSLIFWGIGLILVDKNGRSKKLKKEGPQTLTEDKNKSQSAKSEPNSKQSLENINLKQAIIIGLGQCLALIPGTSRSGVTTIFGIISGLTPQNALRYSFLTGIPLIGASGSYAVLKLFTSSTLETPLPNMALATLVSFGVGLTAAYILKKFINKNILSICGIYRIILGFGILAMIW